eukprot:CAMPEP_0204210008 /NCGR_PEP_ID=MMETSP0361-20130328/73624_1 /ASSEMBLY_ACC=CAM_ASM_000343 /TAXON_ID=268821 /ORGANISM="Scrippsiella Hangoei, Strain SHTV-5" /LENGTH=370 /DNA_ID=CAMNT_0051174073 /DNA_START=49 /DNA_END=1161 /DNA_ORIENTATION=+
MAMQSVFPPTPKEDSHLLGDTTARTRCAHVDVLKGVGILLVVLLHSFPPSLSDPTSLSHKLYGWLGWVVPGFFACSGFLYAKNTSIAAVPRRLVRLVPAYVCASVAAMLAKNAFIAPVPLEEWFSALVWGEALDLFYFVPMLAFFTVATPAIGQLPPWLLRCLLAVAVVAHFHKQYSGVEQMATFPFPPPEIFWIYRNPINWFGYFLLGWLSPLVQATPGQGVVAIAAVWLLRLAALHIWSEGLNFALTDVCGLLAWNYTVVLCAPILLPPGKAPSLPFGRQLEWLSANSYTIYLYHFFFGFFFSTWLVVDPASSLASLAALSFALAGTCGIALVAPRVLGPAVSGAVFGCVGDQGPSAAAAAEDVKAAV